MSSRELTLEVEERVRRRFETAAVGDGANMRKLEPVELLDELLAEEAPLVDPQVRHRCARLLAVELVGFGPIQRLLEDPYVTDVLVNGPGTVWVERSGRLQPSELVVDHQEIARAIERLVGPLGLRADRSNPIVDARLDDGSRATVVLPPLAIDGPVLAIRRHGIETFPLDHFGPADVVEMLKEIVDSRQNTVVYGSTGSGKTSLLNALASLISEDERVITVEDVAELKFGGAHLVRLEARPGGHGGVGRTEIRDLVRASLRLRPDRIVVGEVRGAEAIDMIWAMSTGHRGCFSTCHASGPRDVIRRIQTMILLGAEQLPADAVSAQVHSAIDVVVGVGRQSNGSRCVTAVHRVGANGTIDALYTTETRTAATVS